MRLRILQRANGHHQCGERFHRLRIVNQEHHHAVIEANSLILTGVLIAFTNGFLKGLPTGVCLT